MDLTDDIEHLLKFNQSLCSYDTNEIESFFHKDFKGCWPQYSVEECTSRSTLRILHGLMANRKKIIINKIESFDRFEWVSRISLEEALYLGESQSNIQEFLISIYEIRDESILSLIQYISPIRNTGRSLEELSTLFIL